MKQLKFSNPVFHDGENVTVRRGTQWSGVSGVIPIDSEWSANILFTKCLAFKDVNEYDIELEHDDSCKTYNGLLQEMRRLYSGFDEREIITIVHFTPIKNESAA